MQCCCGVLCIFASRLSIVRAVKLECMPSSWNSNWWGSSHFHPNPPHSPTFADRCSQPASLLCRITQTTPSHKKKQLSCVTKRSCSLGPRFRWRRRGSRGVVKLCHSTRCVYSASWTVVWRPNSIYFDCMSRLVQRIP